MVSSHPGGCISIIALPGRRAKLHVAVEPLEEGALHPTKSGNNGAFKKRVACIGHQLGNYKSQKSGRKQSDFALRLEGLMLLK